MRMRIIAQYNNGDYNNNYYLSSLEIIIALYKCIINVNIQPFLIIIVLRLNGLLETILINGYLALK